MTCATKLDADGGEAVRGVDLLAFRFHSAADGCFSPYNADGKNYNPSRNGRLLLNSQSGSMIRFEEETNEFPASFNVDRGSTVESWDYVKIGDGAYLLPVASDWIFRFSSGEMLRVTVEYKNHRHFEAATNVTFH